MAECTCDLTHTSAGCPAHGIDNGPTEYDKGYKHGHKVAEVTAEKQIKWYKSREKQLREGFGLALDILSGETPKEDATIEMLQEIYENIG